MPGRPLGTQVASRRSNGKATAGGHVDTVQLQASLEAKVNQGFASINDRLDLVALYFGPAQQGEKAADEIEAVLAAHPEDDLVRVWFALIALHVLMHQSSMRRALGLLEEMVRRRGALVGAACLLMAQLAQEVGYPAEDVRALLERSIESERGWYLNHYLLAFSYAELGRRDEAAVQLRAAVANTIAPDPSWPPRQRGFEVEVTGRAGYGASRRAQEALEALQK